VFTCVEVVSNMAAADMDIGWASEGITPQDIIDRTLIFRVLNKRRYFLRADFQSHLDSLVDEKDVFGFGSPGRNDTWHVTLRSKEAKTRIMVAGDFLVENTLVRVRSMGTDEFVARIHWLPMFIPMATVVEELAKHGEVLSYRWEKSPGSHWADAVTLVRSVTMRGDLEKIPHLMELGWHEHKAEALVTITGRKPLCLRCKEGGHFRNECKALYCRRCQGFGTHATEDCVRPVMAPRYAQVVQPPTDLSQHDDPMEASQSLLTDPPFAQKDTSVRGGLDTPEVVPGDSVPGQGDTSVRGGHSAPEVPLGVSEALGTPDDSGQVQLESQESVGDSQESAVLCNQEAEKQRLEEKRKKRAVVQRRRKEEEQRIELAERYKVEMAEADEWLRREAEREAGREEPLESYGKDFQTVSVKRKSKHSGGFPKVSKGDSDSVDVSDRYGTLRDLVKDEMGIEDEPPDLGLGMDLK